MLGVYKLSFKQNPTKVYIGSSKSCYYRVHDHIHKLKIGKHVIADLQKDFDTYGLENFESTVTPCENARALEKQEIIKHRNTYGEENLYNKVEPSGIEWGTNRKIDIYCSDLKKRFTSERELLEILSKLGISITSAGTILYNMNLCGTCYRLSWEQYNNQLVTKEYDRLDLARHRLRTVFGKQNIYYSSVDKILCYSDREFDSFMNKQHNTKNAASKYRDNSLPLHLGVVQLRPNDLVDDKYLQLLNLNPFEIADKSGLV